jgi:ribosomal protein S18 acetylase RimI-like enzyme
MSAADERPAIARYLERSPGMSFVTVEDETVVAAVLCGHDGRRGFIHHLAVHSAYQRQGIGEALVERCLEALRRERIDKCHLFVYAANTQAQGFWQRLGWKQRDDLLLMSKNIE